MAANHRTGGDPADPRWADFEPPGACLPAGHRAIPAYAYPEGAARALGRAAAYSAWRQRQRGHVPDLAGLRTADARALCQDMGQAYKVEHIDDELKQFPSLSFYRQGEFIDLCRGPHIPHAGKREGLDADTV